MKKLFVILISFLLVMLSGCSVGNFQNLSSDASRISFAPSNNVTMHASSMGFKNGKPYISVLIKNRSDEFNIIYGEQFHILEGKKELKSMKTIAWNDLAYTVGCSMSGSQTYYLDGYNLKENKTYRLVKNYIIEGIEETYSTYLDFEIDRSEIRGCVLTKSDTVWTHNDYVSNDDITMYLLGDDNILYSKLSNNQPVIIKNWYEKYKLEEFKLTKDDFKGLSNGKWHLKGNSAEKVIANNEVALRYIEDKLGNFHYILKQKDGIVYYVKGWAGVDGLYQISIMNVM